MFNFTPDQQGNAGGDRFVERFEATQFNLAVQRNDDYQASQALARIVGWFLSRRAAG